MCEKMPRSGSAVWRQDAAAGEAGWRDVLRTVAPGAEDARADRQVHINVWADLDDLADFFVAPRRDRVVRGVLTAADEQALGRVPVLVQVRVGAAVEGHFGARAETGEERAHAGSWSARERHRRQVDERHLARREQGDGNGRHGQWTLTGQGTTQLTTPVEERSVSTAVWTAPLTCPNLCTRALPRACAATFAKASTRRPAPARRSRSGPPAGRQSRYSPPRAAPAARRGRHSQTVPGRGSFVPDESLRRTGRLDRHDPALGRSRAQSGADQRRRGDRPPGRLFAGAGHLRRRALARDRADPAHRRPGRERADRVRRRRAARRAERCVDWSTAAFRWC